MNYLLNAECINTTIEPYWFNDRYGWNTLTLIEFIL